METLYINKRSHLEHILASLDELLLVSKKTSAPSDNCFQYLGTTVDNTILLLTAPAKILDDGYRRLIFNEDKNWVSLMQEVHRSFFSSIQVAVEKALTEQCGSVENNNKKRLIVFRTNWAIK